MELRLRIGMVVLALLTPAAAWARFEPVTCNNSFTVEQEIAEGNKVAAQVYRQMPVLPDSDPVSRYVQNLGARIVQFAPPSPGTGTRWPYNFHVVASEEINAFALPGGSMFVNLGTLQAAETEAQLAGVMAHEISHVVMRHSTCNLSRQQKRSVLYGIGAIGSAILLGGAAGQLAQTGIGAAQGLDFLHMSRDYERQADLLGVNILYDAGYDPRGLPQFFETISAKYGQGGAQLLSDHPNPGNRTEYVNAEIATLPPQPDQTVTSATFKAAKATAETERTYTAKEVQAGVWRQTGLYTAGPGRPASVIAASGSASAGAATPAPAGPAPVLSQAVLAVDGPTTVLQASRFRLRYPQAWQQTTDVKGNVTLAPEGGAGSFGVGYGALVNLAPMNGGGVSGGASLMQATAGLVKQLSQGTPGLEQAGEITATRVNGHAASAVNLRGPSPVVDGATPLMERDWLVAVARPDGDLSYIVFVAPERDFVAMKPAFDAMLASFEPQ